MTVVCYTDASYRKEYDIAACGYCVLVKGKMIKHEVLLVSEIGGPGQAEVYSIVQAAQFAFMMEGVKKILIHTDYKSAVDRKNRHRMNKKCERYKELKETIEMITDFGVQIELFFVKGHSTCKHNNIVDKGCRHNLRKYIKDNAIG